MSRKKRWKDGVIIPRKIISYRPSQSMRMILANTHRLSAVKLRQKFGGNNRNLVMGDRGESFNRDLSGHNDNSVHLEIIATDDANRTGGELCRVGVTGYGNRRAFRLPHTARHKSRMWLCKRYEKRRGRVSYRSVNIRDANPDARFCWRVRNIAPDNRLSQQTVFRSPEENASRIGR